MKLHYFPSPEATNTLSTDELRERFMINGLMQPGAVTAHYTDLDRMIVGAAVPTTSALPLPNAKETGTSYFLERREIGILNIGAPGTVRVGNTAYELANLDCLYIGLGEKNVTFETKAGGQAQFAFFSTPAHAKHPTALSRRADIRTDPIGDPAKANRRRINRLIHPDGIKSCQLVMGFTEFEPGSVWNTMPAHTHSRRTEIYLYFDMGDNVVFHFMGEPTKTRHLVIRDREVILSPAWSIHCGAGTGAYRFIWAMGGDNQVFSDMDAVPMTELK
ncbi:5-dehydro-4-deoxy-D-glucuronate isomerase [Opitutus sp. ER46]|uniref:5-dehydro-4-deoxy-D-glucuronate isomerase n=1 Tax=Opitutus sp. ER46 TaxID=2161864 RepID=UPI000D3185D1|nr:5-dehydro-4-deoxy-D-glucuronate isomerase [Opitutus sp. ER46]PTX92723.1 5-dehydro-4-deoxy-D-glucuronate isomerase [Opitutus sp. ER46]